MRLAFAIATEVDPDILLIDESLGVGDAAFQEKAKARIRGLFERTKVVILVSHDMESLRELCTRGLWIEHGQARGRRTDRRGHRRVTCRRIGSHCGRSRFGW